MRIGIIGVGRIGGNAARLFADAGHDESAAVDLGGTADAAALQPTRRDGAVYGEDRAAADAVVEALRIGRPIPRAPLYESWRAAECVRG